MRSSFLNCSAALIVAAVALGDTPLVFAQEELQANLDAARTVWNGLEKEYGYKFSYELFCDDCDQFVDYPWYVDVGELSTVTSVTNADESTLEYFGSKQTTIESFFDKIQSAIDSEDDDALSIAVSYNDRYGYPNSLRIDYNGEEEENFRAQISTFTLATTPPDDSDVVARRIANANAETLWNTRGGSLDYDFSYAWIQFRPLINYPLVVKVRNGVVTSTVDRLNNTLKNDQARTIEDVFRTIEEAFAQEAHRVTVAYDARFGYPKTTSLDYNPRIADDELYVTIYSYKPVLIRDSTTNEDGGTTDNEKQVWTTTESENDYRTGLETWNNRTVQNYKFQYSWVTFRPMIAYPLDVEVREGKISKVTDRNNNDILGQEVAHTVDDLFEAIGEAFRKGAYDVQAFYDSEYGFPSNFTIDYNYPLTDDELYVKIYKFEEFDVSNPPTNVVDEEAMTALQNALDLWEGAGINSYEFEFSFINTRRDLVFPLRVRVVDGFVETLVDGNNAPVDTAEVFTMNYFLSTIEAAIEMSAFQVVVKYNETLGYPLDISIDYDENTVDEEFYVEITSFRPIVFSNPVLEALEEARLQWDLSQPSPYIYEFEQSCPVCPNENFPWSIQVGKNSSVVTAIDVTGGPVSPNDPIPRYTIVEIFDMIASAAEAGAPVIVVDYHDPLGYPMNVLIDYDPARTDDDVRFKVNSLALDSSTTTTTDNTTSAATNQTTILDLMLQVSANILLALGWL